MKHHICRDDNILSGNINELIEEIINRMPKFMQKFSIFVSIVDEKYQYFLGLSVFYFFQSWEESGSEGSETAGGGMRAKSDNLRRGQIFLDVSRGLARGGYVGLPQKSPERGFRPSISLDSLGDK